MRTYKLSCTILCLIVNIYSYSQEVTTASGDFLQNEYGSLSTTLGEVVTETFKSDNLILTQGFQQCDVQVTLVKDKDLQGVNINVYPNPTKDQLKIEINTDENISFHYQLSDIHGKKIIKNKCNTSTTSLNINSLPNSTYFLEVFLRKSESISFKIIKQ